MLTRSHVAFVLAATAGAVAIYAIDRSSQENLKRRLDPDADFWSAWNHRAQAQNRLADEHNAHLTRIARKRNKQPRILKDHEFDAFGL